MRGRNHYPQDIERTAEAAVTGAVRGRLDMGKEGTEGREGMNYCSHEPARVHRTQTPQHPAVCSRFRWVACAFFGRYRYIFVTCFLTVVGGAYS